MSQKEHSVAQIIMYIVPNLIFDNIVRFILKVLYRYFGDYLIFVNGLIYLLLLLSGVVRIIRLILLFCIINVILWSFSCLLLSTMQMIIIFINFLLVITFVNNN